MTRRASALLALGAALALALGACGRSGGAPKDPGAQLIAHLDRMIAILEDNRQEPEKAARALAAYQEEHEAELERLKQALADSMQKDPMKAAAVSSLYGLKSAELAARTAELTAKAPSPAQ